MLLKLKTAPAVEPLSLLEVKTHLRLDSQSLADNLTSVQTIASGSHVIAAAYGLVGSSVEVLGYQTMVFLEAGACGAGGSVAAKIQESADAATWTDWSGGAFTLVTEANDNATQEKEYTGTKSYIRVVATIAGATCEFGVSVLKIAPYSTEDTDLSGFIITARSEVEKLCGPLITQTWEQYEKDWPSGDRLSIGKNRLLTVESIIYTDEDSVEATLAAASYLVDIIDTYKPGVVLKDDYDWPTANLLKLNPIKITFTAGFGPAATDIPEPIKSWMKVFIGMLYYNRELAWVSNVSQALIEINRFDGLLTDYRVW